MKGHEFSPDSSRRRPASAGAGIPTGATERAPGAPQTTCPGATPRTRRHGFIVCKPASFTRGPVQLSRGRIPGLKRQPTSATPAPDRATCELSADNAPTIIVCDRARNVATDGAPLDRHDGHAAHGVHGCLPAASRSAIIFVSRSSIHGCTGNPPTAALMVKREHLKTRAACDLLPLAAAMTAAILFRSTSDRGA